MNGIYFLAEILCYKGFQKEEVKQVEFNLD